MKPYITSQHIMHPEGIASSVPVSSDDTYWSFDRLKNVADWFSAQRGNDTAVCAGEQTITYAELDDRSNQLARYLLAKGTKQHDLIPVCMEKSIDLIVSILGVVKAGAAYVPVSPANPGKRISYILKDTAAPIVLTNNTGIHLFSDEPCVEVIQLDKVLPEVMKLPTEHPQLNISPDDLVYVIYTSGSTGTPKGVMITHGSLTNLITWHNEKFGVSTHSKLSSTAGIGFDICVWEIWSSLTSGATLFLTDNDTRTDAALLFQYFSDHQVTHAFVPAVLTAEFVDHSRHKISSLQHVFTAGEQMKPVSTVGLPYTLTDYYGPTETTIFSTCNILPGNNEHYVSSIGRPVANTQVYILSPLLEHLPAGAAGELCIAGAGLAKGYLNNEALTNEKFVLLDNGGIKGTRIYRTGDLARWLPDGRIQYLGRMDDQAKIRGYRIEPGEIAAVLTRIPAIKQAEVIVYEQRAGNKQLIAFIVSSAASDEKTMISQAKEQLQKELPAYMIPSVILAVEKIPHTENGKTDKAALAAIVRQRVVDDHNIVAPASEYEKVIAEIWGDVLGRDVISVTEDFFEAGGHSVMVAKVRVRVSATLSIKMYTRDLYEYRTVRSLADMLTERQAAETNAGTEHEREPIKELKDDIWLPEDIMLNGTFDTSLLQQQRNVFLTGVTGFVGIHLLAELLQQTTANVYCLVRSDNEYNAISRIKDCFETYYIKLPAEAASRIIPVPGDLTQPLLGMSPGRFDQLAREVDVIYHSGSSVNFIEPYSYMKHPNVDGMREIVRLAAQHKTKCISLMSTISVYSWGHLFTGKTSVMENDDIHENLDAVITDIGYVRSKWVMEGIADLAIALGIPVMIFRLGYATCNSQTGVNAAYQWWGGLVKTCIKHGCYPALDKLREGLTTVDYMVSAVVHITQQQAAIGKRFNLIPSPEKNLTLMQFFERLNEYYGFNLCSVPYHDWLSFWDKNQHAPLFPLLSLFKDNMFNGQSTVELYQHTYLWDCRNTQQFLEGSGIQEPEFNKEVMDRYMKRLGISM
ncbi:MAG TPA: amino acid adenylation domain-containing protein [Chitinophaga sp.]|nr:amino acid adenylation domain-containing protein [Chitinophaga sp.]